MTTWSVGERSAMSTSGSHGKRKNGVSWSSLALTLTRRRAALVFRADDDSVVRDFVATTPTSAKPRQEVGHPAVDRRDWRPVTAIPLSSAASRQITRVCAARTSLRLDG